MSPSHSHPPVQAPLHHVSSKKFQHADELRMIMLFFVVVIVRAKRRHKIREIIFCRKETCSDGSKSLLRIIVIMYLVEI